MAETLKIALFASPLEWQQDLVRWARAHGDAEIVTISSTAAHFEQSDFDVLVMDWLAASTLTRDRISNLHAQSKRTVGLHNLEEFADSLRDLEELGLDGYQDHEIAPADLYDYVTVQLLPRLQRSGAYRQDVSRETVQAIDRDRRGLGRAGIDRGFIIAVGGPAGGPGATEVAIGLSDVLAKQRNKVALVDCDSMAPVLLQRLTLEPLPNLFSTVQKVRKTSGVEQLTRVRGARFDALPGMPPESDASQFTESDVRAAMFRLSREKGHVIADIGHDIAAPATTGGRSAVSRGALVAADIVVGVSAETPQSIARLLEWLTTVRETNTHARGVIVVNHSPKRGYYREQIRREIREAFQAPIVFIPTDRRVREACWKGEVIPEHAVFMRQIEKMTQGRRGQSPLIPQPARKDREDDTPAARKQKAKERKAAEKSAKKAAKAAAKAAKSKPKKIKPSKAPTAPTPAATAPRPPSAQPPAAQPASPPAASQPPSPSTAAGEESPPWMVGGGQPSRPARKLADQARDPRQLAAERRQREREQASPGTPMEG